MSKVENRNQILP